MNIKNLLFNKAYRFLLVHISLLLCVSLSAQLVSTEMPLKAVEAGEWEEIQRNNGTSG